MHIDKTPVKFQKDPAAIIVGEAAFTRCPVGSNCEKSNKTNLMITSKPHAHLQTLTKHLQSLKKIFKIVGGAVFAVRWRS